MSCSLALCIVTYKRSELIRDFLANCANYYGEAGVDIYIYDSSPDQSTEAVVRAWPKQERLFYVRLPSELTLNEKFLRIFQREGLKKEYDFLSVSNDATQYTPEDIKAIVEGLDLDFDFVAFGCEKEIGTKTFTDPDAFLLACIKDIRHIGATALNVQTMLEGIDWIRYEDLLMTDHAQGPYAFGLGAFMVFYFRRFLELEQFHALYLKIDGRRLSPLKKEAFYECDPIVFLCENTIKTYEKLPDVYKSKWKASVINNADNLAGGLSDFLQFRRQGYFNLHRFFQYWTAWKRVTPVSRVKLLFAAILPKSWISIVVKLKKSGGQRRLRRFCCGHGRLAVYGAGNHGAVFGKYLEQNGIPYDFFCVSRRRADKYEFLGHPVYVFDELAETERKDVGFIVALSSKNAAEVVPKLIAAVGAENVLYDADFEAKIRNDMGYRAYQGV